MRAGFEPLIEFQRALGRNATTARSRTEVSQRLADVDGVFDGAGSVEAVDPGWTLERRKGHRTSDARSVE